MVLRWASTVPSTTSFRKFREGLAAPSPASHVIDMRAYSIPRAPSRGLPCPQHDGDESLLQKQNTRSISPWRATSESGPLCPLRPSEVSTLRRDLLLQRKHLAFDRSFLSLHVPGHTRVQRSQLHIQTLIPERRSKSQPAERGTTKPHSSQTPTERCGRSASTNCRSTLPPSTGAWPGICGITMGSGTTSGSLCRRRCSSYQSASKLLIRKRHPNTHPIVRFSPAADGRSRVKNDPERSSIPGSRLLESCTRFAITERANEEVAS